MTQHPPFNLYKALSFKHIACYFCALFLTLWCLGKSLPGVGVGAFVPGVLMLLYLSPALLMKKQLQLSNKVLFFMFIGMHLILINPVGDNKFTLDFTIRLFVGFCFFVALVNVVDELLIYRRMLLLMISLLSLLCVVLVYKHVFVFHTPYLTAHFSGIETVGRGGKNTLSFFLAVMFPFIYARFSHDRDLVSGTFLAIITFSLLYTVSRMALLGMGVSVVSLCIFSIRRILFIKQTAFLLLLLVVLSASLGVGMKTFMNFRNVTEVEEVEDDSSSGFVSFEGHRFHMIQVGLNGLAKKPILGHGTTSFRGMLETGGSLSHNDYLQVLYELGLLGFSLLAGIILLSLKGLISAKRYVSPMDRWVWDGQVACLLSTSVMLLFINAYETVVFWFVLAGCEILRRVYISSNDSNVSSGLVNVNG